MKLSASQAAKKTGKSIPTITRSIKSGKLSAEKTVSGGYQIDASELFRVFSAVPEEPNVKGNALGSETLKNTAEQSPEARLLKDKIEALEAALSDAKSERDEWRDQAKRLSQALPSPDIAQTAKKSLWERLLNR